MQILYTQSGLCIQTRMYFFDLIDDIPPQELVSPGEVDLPPQDPYELRYFFAARRCERFEQLREILKNSPECFSRLIVMELLTLVNNMKNGEFPDTEQLEDFKKWCKAYLKVVPVSL